MYIRIPSLSRGEIGFGIEREELLQLSQSSAHLLTLGPDVRWTPGELTWLDGRLHPSYHSMVQEVQGAQTSAVQEVAWQREFPERCGPQHE